MPTRLKQRNRLINNILTRNTSSVYLTRMALRPEKIVRLLPLTLALAGISGLAGCVHLPRPATPAQIKELQTALNHLSPEVRTNETAHVAMLAFEYPRQLASEYRLVRPPLFHNLLINLHLKQRGLCYQWAEDLAAKLQTLHLESLELHWGVAHPESVREHNTVVITAWNKPFATGIVLDPWRRSGSLVWRNVTNDSYQWFETELYLPPPATPPVTP